jgi:hypothetical protein
MLKLVCLQASTKPHVHQKFDIFWTNIASTMACPNSKNGPKNELHPLGIKLAIFLWILFLFSRGFQCTKICIKILYEDVSTVRCTKSWSMWCVHLDTFVHGFCMPCALLVLKIGFRVMYSDKHSKRCFIREQRICL